MSKIDIDKFVAFEYKRQLQFTPSNAKNFFLMALDKSLEEQGLCYKDGEIIEIEQQPDNSFQISKDLQELTEFEQELYNFMQQAQVEKRLEDADVLAEFVRKYSFVLLEKSYKQFKQDQLNQEFATFTRQEFNDAVDEEIKRRCEGIDASKMVNDYITIQQHYVGCETWYMKGVEDTIKKLKGE